MDALSWTDPVTLAILAAAFVAIGAVKGITGIGMPLVGVPMISQITTLQEAITLLTAPMILTNIKQSVDRRGKLINKADFLYILLPFVPACLVGFYLINRNSSVRIAYIISGLLLLLCVFVQKILRERAEAYVRSGGFFSNLVVGTISGVMGGATGIPGPPFFMYLTANGIRGVDFARNASVFLVIAAGMLALILGMVGAGQIILISLTICTIPAFIGMFFGERLREYLTPAQFADAIYLLVGLSALDFVWRGLS